jgi:cation diffusion facilitator family transporter
VSDSTHGLHRGIRAARAGLLLNAVLAVFKGVAGVVGNSFALVADAVESLGDILGSIVVWSGLRVAAQDADSDHPYGHGRAESIAAATVGVMLVLAGIGIVVRGVHWLLRPHPVPAAWTLLVLVLVVAIKEGFFRRVLRLASDLGSYAVAADAWHHRSDAISSAAAFVGVSIAVIGGASWYWADEAGAIIAGLLIAKNGAQILRPALHDLMDGAPDATLVQRVREVAEAVVGVHSTEKLMARRVGTRMWVDLHVQADPAMSLHDAHELGHEVKRAICRELPVVENVLVHMEPAEMGPSGPTA